MPQRDFTVDALKGLAIACVVMGHAVLRNVAGHSDNWLYLLLSSFEMPLFMFLSGYVLAGRVRAPRGRWVAKRALRLLVPFIAWQAIFYLTLRLTPAAWGEATGATLAGLVGYVSTVFAAPTAGLWYLPALLICSALLALLYPLAQRRFGPILILVAGALLLEVVAQVRTAAGVDADFGLLKVLTLWPVFAAGFAWGQWGRSLDPGAPRSWWLLTGVFPFLAIPAMRSLPGMGTYETRALKVSLGLAGTAAAAVLLRALEPVARRVRLDELGRLTMGIYCAHWLFLRVEFAQGALGALAAFAFSLTGATLLTLAIRRVPLAAGILLGEWPSRR